MNRIGRMRHPCGPTNDAGDVRLRHAELAGERHLGFTGGVPGADGGDLIGRQLRPVVRFAGHRPTATLRDHVGDVIGLGAEKEVSRIAARRVIATVKHLHAIGDGAVGQFPSTAMGKARSVSAAYQRAIAIRGAGSGPLPTRAWVMRAGEPRPEPTVCGNDSGLVPTRTGTEPTRAPSSVARHNCKARSAGLAHAVNPLFRIVLGVARHRAETSTALGVDNAQGKRRTAAITDEVHAPRHHHPSVRRYWPVGELPTR